MAKYILIASIISIFSFCAPSTANANAIIEIIDNDLIQGSANAQIVVDGSSVRVIGANGQKLYVYNVAGVRIQSIKVEGADKHFDLNLPKGCYILKVGKTVRKVSVK